MLGDTKGDVEYVTVTDELPLVIGERLNDVLIDVDKVVIKVELKVLEMDSVSEVVIDDTIEEVWLELPELVTDVDIDNDAVVIPERDTVEESLLLADVEKLVVTEDICVADTVDDKVKEGELDIVTDFDEVAEVNAVELPVVDTVVETEELPDSVAVLDIVEVCVETSQLKKLPAINSPRASFKASTKVPQSSVP